MRHIWQAEVRYHIWLLRFNIPYLLENIMQYMVFSDRTWHLYYELCVWGVLGLAMAFMNFAI